MKWFTLRSSKGWILAAGAAAVVGGIGIGLLVDLQPAADTPANSLAIDEVLLGRPVTPPTADEPWSGSSRLTQQRTYATDELLALRVVSRESPERQFSLTARLLQENGSLQSLSPASVTVSGGTSGYCCWTIAEPGKYKLQIFADQQAPFVVPVTIVPARTNVSPIQIH